MFTVFYITIHTKKEEMFSAINENSMNTNEDQIRSCPQMKWNKRMK